MARSNLDERQSAFGPAKNAATRLPETHTMLPVNATVTVSDKDKTKAIFESIRADNRFYPENPTKTKISMKKNTIHIEIDATELSHLRANLNSTLRLIQASSDSLESLRL